ncbi:MAG: hypothetical protein ACM3S2_16980 [Ignavibacteriales bacterium]
MLQEKISYYENLKTVTKEDEPDQDIMDRIMRKIPEYKPESVVELFPLEETYGRTVTVPGIVTFSDKGSKYFVRVEDIDSTSRIYVFSPREKVLFNYTLTFIPSGLSITQKDNLFPGVIPKAEKIESIRLNFNPEE